MKRFLIGSTLLAALTPAAAFAAWTKTYVIEWNEPAMYYGAKTGVVDPGADVRLVAILKSIGSSVMDAGYTKEEADCLRNRPIQRAVLCTVKTKWPSR